MKFKVGDKVRAIDDEYGYTNKDLGFVGVVTEVYKGKVECICVETISSLEKSEIGEEYVVDSEHFELVEEPTEFTFEDLVRMKDEKVYECTNKIYVVKTVQVFKNGRIEINLSNERDEIAVSHNARFKLQEPKKKYVLYGIEHQEDGKIYFFRSKEDKVIPDTSFVICNTSKGKSYGRAVQRIEKELTESEYLKYKECWRA